MVRGAGVVLAIVAALALAPRGQPQVTHPYVGITYVDRVESAPRPVHMHIVQVDLSAPGVRIALSPPAGGREVARQSTLEFLKAQHAQFAINGHFFLPFPSLDSEAWVIGLAASEGRVYSAFELPEQNFALVGDAPAINIDARNRARLVHRDPKQPDGRHVRERVTLWNAVAGSAQIVTDGEVTIPTYRDEAHPLGLLALGGPNSYSNEKSWYDVANARTALGLSRNHKILTFFTVDIRGGSEGMPLGEVARLLIKDYGVWNALNLDGGGSTSIAWQDPATGEAALLNASSDNPAGRIVASSLAVFARRH